jgi:hypothetical protein
MLITPSPPAFPLFFSFLAYPLLDMARQKIEKGKQRALPEDDDEDDERNRQARAAQATLSKTGASGKRAAKARAEDEEEDADNNADDDGDDDMDLDNDLDADDDMDVDPDDGEAEEEGIDKGFVDEIRGLLAAQKGMFTWSIWHSLTRIWPQRSCGW